MIDVFVVINVIDCWFHLYKPLFLPEQFLCPIFFLYRVKVFMSSFSFLIGGVIAKLVWYCVNSDITKGIFLCWTRCVLCTSFCVMTSHIDKLINSSVSLYSTLRRALWRRAIVFWIVSEFILESDLFTRTILNTNQYIVS